jgi:hypothetical protein
LFFLFEVCEEERDSG